MIIQQIAFEQCKFWTSLTRDHLKVTNGFLYLPVANLICMTALLQSDTCENVNCDTLAHIYIY